MRKTRIIITLGPTTDNPDILRQLLAMPINLARLNMSHGKHADHAARIAKLRTLAAEQGQECALIADLQGPKIRIASFATPGGKIKLQAGESFALDAAWPDDSGDQKQVGLGYKSLPQEVAVGDKLLLDDGKLSLQVQSIIDQRINCLCLNTAELGSNKGLNRQGGGLLAETLTAKDLSDIEFAIKQQVDYLALSFVSSAADLMKLRAILQQAQAEHIGIIAKIERAESLANLAEIIPHSDAIMIARGDLGLEIGLAFVPGWQAEIIEQCQRYGVPVITATQMLESMITNPMPTRAEVNDVATAVWTGSDGVMLSAETANGAYPVAAVQQLAEICEVTEARLEKSNASTLELAKFAMNTWSAYLAGAAVELAASMNWAIAGIFVLDNDLELVAWLSKLIKSRPIYLFNPEWQVNSIFEPNLQERNIWLRKVCLYPNVQLLNLPSVVAGLSQNSGEQQLQAWLQSWQAELGAANELLWLLIVGEVPAACQLVTKSLRLIG